MAGHTGDRQTVTDGLQHDLPEARRTALGAAARLDMLAAPDLRPFLDDPDHDVRHRALELAGRLDDGHLLLDDLLAFLAAGDPSPGHPSSAAPSTTASEGGVRHETGLPESNLPDSGLSDDGANGTDVTDHDLAEVAAFAIGELDLDDADRQRAGAALGRQATGHPDPLCRESAVAALGALGVGLEAVLAATGDVATVRRRAVLALAPFDGPQVTEALEAALQDRDWQVRQAAEDLQDPDEPPSQSDGTAEPERSA